MAIGDGAIACWDGKYTYWQIRPYQQGTTPVFPTPNHPSYPGAHACGSSASATVLAYLFPRDAADLNARGAEAGESRIWAGIHYRSDTDAGLALGRSVAALVIERAKSDGSQVKLLVNGITFTPNAIKSGDSFTAAISGIGLSPTTYVDIRFRRPGSDTDEIAVNWQEGLMATHAIAAGTPVGTWLVTGVRSHEVIDDFSGDFVSMSAALQVTR